MVPSVKQRHAYCRVWGVENDHGVWGGPQGKPQISPPGCQAQSSHHWWTMYASKPPLSLSYIVAFKLVSNLMCTHQPSMHTPSSVRVSLTCSKAWRRHAFCRTTPSKCRCRYCGLKSTLRCSDTLQCACTCLCTAFFAPAIIYGQTDLLRL